MADPDVKTATRDDAIEWLRNAQINFQTCGKGLAPEAHLFYGLATSQLNNVLKVLERLSDEEN